MMIMVIIMSHNHIKLFHCFADGDNLGDNVRTQSIEKQADECIPTLDHASVATLT